METNDQAPSIDYGVYLMDLTHQIRAVDAMVFQSVGRSTCGVLLLNEFSDKNMPGNHIGNLVTFMGEIMLFNDPTVLTLSTKQESYIIWKSNLIRRLKYILEGFSLSGVGDKEISESWFMIAVALARLRVLFHLDWFKNVRQRDRKSLPLYRDFFVENGDEIGTLRKLFGEFDSIIAEMRTQKDGHISIDVYWTLRLVAQALERGMPLQEALMLVTT